MRRFLHLIAAIVVLGSLTTACGLQLDDRAQVIDTADLPPDLVSGAVSTLVPEINARDYQLYMVGPDNRLTTVARTITRNPEAVMTSLLVGPTTLESGQGIKSAITRATQVLSVTWNDEGVVFVNLTEGSLASSARNELELAFAQIVYSITGLPEFDQVVFSIDGVTVPVPTDGGTSDPGQPVTRLDFKSVDRRSVDFVVGGEGDPVVPTPLPIPTRPAGSNRANRTEVPIWLIDADGNLTAAIRLIERSPEALLDSLLLGQSLVEGNAGISTFISANALAINIDVDETTNTAFVDLTAGSLPSIANGAKLRAVAQIVYTLTELAEIEKVVISIGGVREPMPTDRGLTDPDNPAVSRDDYTTIGPKSAPVAAPGLAPTVAAQPVPTPDPAAPVASPTPIAAATVTPVPTPLPGTTPTPTPSPTPG